MKTNKLTKLKANEANSGGSLLEAILALAIFALIASALAAMTLGGYQGLGYGTDYLEASALADEALEAARSVRDGAWNEFIITPARVSTTTGQWQLVSAPNEIIGKFTRTLTFAPVCRDGTQNIATCPGVSTDLHSKLVTASVTWQSTSGVTQEVKREAYLTNWDSREWVHTDWTGLTGTNVDVSTAGEIKLAGSPAAWATTTNTGAQTWNDVWTFDEKDAWAVGNGGNIGHFDGTNWTIVAPFPTTRNLNAIYCPTTATCFAVGQSGTIVRWSSGVWGLMSSPTGQVLNGIHCLSATSCFAAGNSGVILQLVGSTWSLHRDTGNHTWNEIWMFSTSNGFVVGANGFIWKLTGSAGSGWEFNQDTGTQTWNDLWMYSTTDGIVVGTGGQVKRYRGGTDWSTNDGTGLTGTWNAVWMTSPTSGWAVGNNASGELIYQRTGTGWQRLALSSLPNVNLFGVHCVSIDLCFASGASGNIFRRSSGGFSTTGSFLSSPFDMSDNSPVQILDWDEAGCAGCDIQIRVGTSANAGGPWTWSSLITDPASVLLPITLNGRQWVQYETTLTGPGDTTPVLQEVRINYK